MAAGPARSMGDRPALPFRYLMTLRAAIGLTLAVWLAACSPGPPAGNEVVLGSHPSLPPSAPGTEPPPDTQTDSSGTSTSEGSPITVDANITVDPLPPEAPEFETPTDTPTDSSGTGASTSPEMAADASITVDAARVIRRIPATIYGSNMEWVFGGYGLWNFATGNLDSTLMQLTGQLGAALLRFPGGVFSDYYHWADGVGPRNERPAREAYPGGPVSPNTFGTDEALATAMAAGAELLVTVNAGTGTPDEAADWVHYVNAGRPPGQPGRVAWWEVGNELYINDGSPTAAPITLSPEDYAARFLQFARAMRRQDSSIRIGAIGGENQGAYTVNSYPEWNAKVLAAAAEEIDFLSIHNAYAPMHFIDRGEDVRTVYTAMLAAPLLIRANLDLLSRQIERYAPNDADRIRVAVTEWGPFFHALPSSRYVDHVKTLGSALFVASALKVFVEHPRVEVANAFKLVDNAFMGWIGLRDGRYTAKAPFFAMQMYTRHFGRDLVSSSATGPTFDSTEVGFVDAVQDVPCLESVASLGADGRLYLLVINKDFDRNLRARIQLNGLSARSEGTAWVLSGTGIDANTGTQLSQFPGLSWAEQAADEVNPRFALGGPGEVNLHAIPIDGIAATFSHVFPAASVTSIEITPSP